MATDYRARLKLPPAAIDAGMDLELFTKDRLLVATGFVRCVIGGRGPYLEFTREQLIQEAMRWVRAGAYYTEYRTIDIFNVKVYEQRWPVDYADYKVGFWYISPFDLVRSDGDSLIDPLPRRQINGRISRRRS